MLVTLPGTWDKPMNKIDKILCPQKAYYCNEEKDNKTVMNKIYSVSKCHGEN